MTLCLPPKKIKIINAFSKDRNITQSNFEIKVKIKVT